MNLGDLMTLFRRDADDEVIPYLWADAEVIEFANDAVTEAVRRARLLVDSRTAEVCTAPIAAGDPWVTLDPRVIFVRRAIIDGAANALCKTQPRALDEMVPGWESSIASTPSHYLQGSGPSELRIWPPAATAGTLRMTVVREPLEALVATDDSPEIPARFHRSLVYWMLYRAFSKPDSDAMDKDRAVMAERSFEAEFGPRSSAREEEWARVHYGMDPYEGQY